MADTKKEYTSNLHPKGDLDTTVYPNVKSENIIDKDTTAYTAGKVPDSSLVSKSLDGLNEKVETNKIQTDTNKTNIATLQGDVSSLKQDNQTTKTTIAGLVSSDTTNKANIAKNTQDIENLSAVMPTDINVDKDFNLVLEHDGKVITGQKNHGLVVWQKYDRYYGDSIDLVAKTADNLLVQNMITFSFNSKHSDYFKYGSTTFDIYSISKNSNFSIYVYNNYADIQFTHTFPNTLTLRLNNPYSSKNLIVNLPTKEGTLALTSDLDAKQSTLYRHTVKISKPTDDGKTSITFTTSSEKNTPIDSIQDLTTVFGNTDLSVSGATYLISSSQWEFYNKIHVGTSINNTTIDYINIDDVGTYNFTDMFGTTGFTITDSVSAL